MTTVAYHLNLANHCSSIALWGARTGPALILFFVLCYPVLSHADAIAIPAGVAKPYQSHVEQALVHYQNQHYVEAWRMFSAANRLWPNARTLRGIGRALYELRQYREAIDFFEYAEESPKHPLSAALRHEVRGLKKKARAALAHVKVQLSPTEATLTIDGLEEFLGPNQELTLDPGAHSVHVTAPGYEPEQRNVKLAQAERTAWHFELTPLALATPLDPLLKATAQTSTAQSGPPSPNDSVLPRSAQKARHTATQPAWLMPVGLSLAVAGSLGATVSVIEYGNYLNAGAKLRFRDTPEQRGAWNDRRSNTLMLSALSAGLLSLGAAALAPSIPRHKRSWVTPTLAIAGAVTLATGLALITANTCSRAASENVATCSTATERQDGGTLLAMASAPLLTIPLVYAVEWLSEL